MTGPMGDAPGPTGAMPSNHAPVSRVVAARYPVAAALAVTIIVVDRLTKIWAEAELADGSIEVIPRILSLSLAENTGASFSLFQGAGPILGVAALVAVVIIWVALRNVDMGTEVVGLGLILGGAVGNFIDRVIRSDGFLDGAVVDFIEFPNFPNFNVADSAITIGAVLLIWSAIRRKD